jgi:hypothetical protein
VKNNIINEESQNTIEMVEAYKKSGKIKKPFFPLATYDMVQCGYPRPDHGEMVARLWGGTDEKGNLLSPKGMWCKVDDVKKLLSENIDPNDPKFSGAINEIEKLEGHSFTTINVLAILERNGFKVARTY